VVVGCHVCWGAIMRHPVGKTAYFVYGPRFMVYYGGLRPCLVREILVFLATVALSFLFDKHYPITE